MSLANLPDFLPYFLSLLITFGVAVLTWLRRDVMGARTYAIASFGQALITAGYILELASPTLRGKFFWDDFQWLGLLLWAVLMPIFALQYTGSDLANQTRTWITLSIFPVVFFLLLLTNGFHGWVHKDGWLIPGAPFDHLLYDFTPLVWIFAIYSYILMFSSYAILLSNYIHMNPIHRLQLGTIVVGTAIPLLGTILSLLNITFGYERDILPFTMAIGNILVAWGLLRFHLFDFVPIARDQVIEYMEDFVFVLDSQNRIVDVNHAARRQFALGNTNIIGSYPLQVFAPWREQVLSLQDITEGETDLQVEVDGKTVHINMRINSVRDHKDRPIGRIYVARDITRQKELEQALRVLNADLEARVQARTQELADAYDSTLEGWARALELRDKETEGHSRRAVELTMKLARALEVPEEDLPHIWRGALLHDIGKMGIPKEILEKPGPLNNEEWDVMKKHPLIGHDLLSHIPFLKKALDIVTYHHERWDGSGYPHGLTGKQIPLAARIFTVVDYWDALRSDRPYRTAWSEADALHYLIKNSGTIFDPRVVEVFLNHCLQIYPK